MNNLAFWRSGRDALQGVRRAAVRALQAANNAAGRPSWPRKTSKLFVYESLVQQIFTSFPRRRTAVRNNSADLKTVILAHAGIEFVRPAWAHSCGCKSRRKLTTANEVKRNCGRATDCGEQACGGCAGTECVLTWGDLASCLKADSAKFVGF